MDAPLCRLCGQRHWNEEPHKWSGAAKAEAIKKAPGPLKKMLAEADEPIKLNAGRGGVRLSGVGGSSDPLGDLVAEVEALRSRVTELEGKEVQSREYQREWARKARAAKKGEK